MRPYALLIAFLIVCGSAIHGQNPTCIYSGVLIDKQSNQPIPYASIYISSLSKGVMTNVDGAFRLELPCKEYQLKIQSLGYETSTVTLSSADSENKTISLVPKTNEMAEITISAKAEDPAYYTMRKAIILAEYYRKQIVKYESDIYLKQIFEIEKTPEILKLFATKEEISEMKAGYLSEIYLNYQFEHPNTVREKIISKRTSEKDTSNTNSAYLNLSFYNIGGGELISPLSKNAFQVYKFQQEDSYEEDGVVVKKIKIIPKRNGNDLMSGYIYINEGLWSINRVDISFKQLMNKIDYKQIYTEVKPLTWFPIHHEINVSATLLGFEGYYKYLASVSNVETENDSIVDAKIASLIDQQLVLNTDGEKMQQKTQEKLSKTQEKIRELMEKDNLTKSETLKMIRLIEKESKEESKNSDEKKSLEVPLTDRKTEYADSAFKKGEETWDTLRATPLTEKEKRIYFRNDSLRNASLFKERDTTSKGKNPIIRKIFLGSGYIKTKNKNHQLNIPGMLVGIRPQFNTVDGLVLRKSLLTYTYNFKENRNITLEPIARYSFARNDLMGNLNISSLYAPKHRGILMITAGKLNTDFNSASPIAPFLNSVSTLFLSENYAKLYQKTFFKITNSIDVANGLQLSSGFEFADRTQLFNHSTFNIFDPKKEGYTSNIPVNTLDSSLFADNKASILSAELSYTPKHYYKMEGNKKTMLNSKFPTFSAKYTYGINHLFGSSADFGLLEFSVNQSRKFGIIDNINYHLGGGMFTHANHIKFADYKHFSTMPFFVSGSPSRNNFRLLDYYNFSTSNYFLEGHFTIENNFILIKRLPLLNRTNWSESIRVSYLKNDVVNNYYEIGYGLNKIFFVLRVEACVSFINNSYQAFGGRVILDLPFRE